MKVKIVSKHDYPELKKIEERLDVVELRLPVETEDVKKVREYANEGAEPDFIIAVGGDATFLRRFDEYDNVPILPIHGGEENSLGWTADFSLVDIDQALNDLEMENYEIVEYRRLKVEFRDNVYDAINDAYVNRKDPVIHCKVYGKKRDGSRELLYPTDLKCDGYVVANAHGSTAYNRAAGGPILFDIDGIVGTPLQSMNYQESIVTGDGFYVEITKNSGILTYDGIKIGDIEEGENFVVTHSADSVKLLKLKSLRETLGSKLERLYNFLYH